MALRKAYSPGTPVPFHGMYRTEKILGGNIPILAADLGTTSNQVALFTIPAGFFLASLRVDTPQLDSGTALTVSLGTVANPTLFLNASTAFRAQAVNVLGSVYGIAGTQFTADTDLIMTITAAAGTPVPGTIQALAFGFINA